MCASVLVLVCGKKDSVTWSWLAAIICSKQLELLSTQNALILLCLFTQPSRCKWSVSYISNSIYQSNHSLESLFPKAVHISQFTVWQAFLGVPSVADLERKNLVRHFLGKDQYSKCGNNFRASAVIWETTGLQILLLHL